MTFLLQIVAAIAILVALIAFSLWLLGRRQPSRAIDGHDTVVFVALKAGDRAKPSFKGTLWSAQASHTLIGDPDAYWTHFFILRAGSDVAAARESAPAYDDAYVVKVALTKIPSVVLGALRARHLLGMTKRPDADLPDTIDEVPGRADILPTQASFEATLAIDPAHSLTMVNFLDYTPDETGDKAQGRRQYRRYGVEAMKAVHAVGGQFLFAGEITRIVHEAEGAPTPGPWDDLAAMIYPDPSAIFQMERIEDYVAAFDYRDAGLRRTVVIASLAD